MNEPTAQLQTVNVYREGGAATVELNRPHALNAWNTQFGLDMIAALSLVADDDVRRGNNRRSHAQSAKPHPAPLLLRRCRRLTTRLGQRGRIVQRKNLIVKIRL